MGSFFSELRRRNVFRVAVLYGVVSWLILQFSDIVMPALGLPEWTITLVLYFLAIGFPIALIFAWAFELTPEGLKRTREVADGESITPVTGQKLNHLIIGVLTVAVTYLLVDKFLLPGSEDSPVRSADQTGAAAPEAVLTSIAVLPFVNMSADPEQEYFADGISEELLNLLAKIEDFKVAGRTSSFAFKGKNDDLRVIAEKLGVTTILEGSVRKDGDQVRVTAQLVKADDGYHLWSETYDRKLESIFAIQDEIAGKVVTALKLTLLDETDTDSAGVTTAALTRERPTDNMEAYTSYLRGQHLIKKRTGDDMFKALGEFRHAVSLDPNFAEAHVGVANGYSLLANYGFRNIEEVGPLAEASIDRALSLNPDLGEAWAAKSLLAELQGAATEQTLPLIERAVALNPNDAQSLVWLAADYIGSGRFDDALATFEKAYALDPLSPIIIFNLANVYKSRDWDEDADRLADELESLMPGQDTPYRLRATLAWHDSDKLDETRWYHRALVADPRSVVALTQIAENAWEYGAYAAAERYARRAREISPSNTEAIGILSFALRMQGDTEGADELLDQSLQLYPDDLFLLGDKAREAYRAGDYDQVFSLLGRVYPHFFEDPPKVKADAGLWWIHNIAWIYRQREDDERAGDLLAAFDEYVGPRMYMYPATANLWRGARDAAVEGDLATLEDYLGKYLQSRNFFHPFLLDPMFQSYADEPAIGAIFDKMRETDRVAREKLTAEGVF